MAYESITAFRDEELEHPYPEPINTNWEDSYKTKRERLLNQAALGLDQNPIIGYGLSSHSNYIPFEKSAEQKAYDTQRKYSRGWRRKGTYIVLPPEKSVK